jgi:hypothetical protein
VDSVLNSIFEFALRCYLCPQPRLLQEKEPLKILDAQAQSSEFQQFDDQPFPRHDPHQLLDNLPDLLTFSGK